MLQPPFFGVIPIPSCPPHHRRCKPPPPHSCGRKPRAIRTNSRKSYASCIIRYCCQRMPTSHLLLYSSSSLDPHSQVHLSCVTRTPFENCVMFGEGTRHQSSSAEAEGGSANGPEVQIHQPASTPSSSTFTALVAAAAADVALSRCQHGCFHCTAAFAFNPQNHPSSHIFATSINVSVTWVSCPASFSSMLSVISSTRSIPFHVLSQEARQIHVTFSPRALFIDAENHAACSYIGYTCILQASVCARTPKL